MVHTASDEGVANTVRDETSTGLVQPALSSPGRVLAVRLQALMGRGGTSWEMAEQQTGHRQATLRTVAQPERQPISVDAALRLMALGGAPLINAVLAAMGYGYARPLEDGLPSAHEMLGDTACVVCELGRALEDGRVDHREEANVAEAVREALPTMKRWLADYDRRTS